MSGLALGGLVKRVLESGTRFAANRGARVVDGARLVVQRQLKEKIRRHHAVVIQLPL